jgi:hypothetical protein
LKSTQFAKTLVIGPPNSIVSTIAGNFKVVGCNPYYLDRGKHADELEAGARTHERMMEESLRDWLQGKIEVPDATISQAVASQGNDSFMRCGDQFEPLGTGSVILGSRRERGQR